MLLECVCKRFQNAMIGCRADISYFDMQEILLYSGFENTPVKSGFWPLVPSDRPVGDVPAMPSWQQAYMVDSQASLPGFSGSPFGLSLQASLLENRSLAPIRQVNFF